jgi:hypothetical protein
MGNWKPFELLMLDGIEQLNWWRRNQIVTKCRRINMSILATSHGKIRGFHELWRTETSDESAEWVVTELLGNEEENTLAKELLTSETWRKTREKHGQNLRETLFDLYDWWHQKHCRT